MDFFSKIYSDERLLKPIPKKVNYVILASILLIYAINVLLRINEHHYPFFDDYAYYNVVFKMDVLGGIGKFWQNVYSGHIQSGWPPLYLFFITPFIEPASDFFNAAVYVNAFFGLIMILTVYWAGKTLFNPIVALISTFLISINPTVLERSAVLAPENLLILFSTLGLVFFVKGFDKNRYWILGLLFSYLAFISKPNGIFLPTAFTLTLFFLALFKWKVLTKRYLYISVILGSFVVFILFHTKLEALLHSEVLQFFTWKINGTDSTEYNALTGMATYPDAMSFVREDFWGFIQRIAWGLIRELHRYAVGLFVSVEWTYKSVFSLNLGIIIVPFFIYLLVHEKNIYMKYFFVTFALVIYLGCVPRASVNHSTARYSIMITPVFYFYLSPLLYSFALWIKEKWRMSPKVFVPTILLFSLLINGIIYHKSIKQFSFFPDFNPNYQKALDWLKNNTKKGDGVIHNPNSQYFYNWYVPWIREITVSPTIGGKDIPFPRLLKRFKEFNVKYITINASAVSPYNKSEYRYFLRGRIIRENGYLKITDLPSQVEVVFQDHSPPKEIIILKIKD